MKQLRPFGIVFLVIQGIFLLALMLLPGCLAGMLDPGLGGLVWLALLLGAALVLLLADAIWVAVVLRRYHARHREVSPRRALVAWGLYLAAAVVGGPCVNFMVLLGGIPPLTPGQWAIFLLLYVIPALIPAAILWFPAFLLSFLDPQYRCTPKKADVQA